MKKYINPILSLGTAAALLGAIYFQNQQIDGLKKQLEVQPIVGGDIQKANLIDSLNDELFNAKAEAGRYELTLEHLKEVNPKLGKQMEDYMAHETE
jgi:hypothetical protein